MQPAAPARRRVISVLGAASAIGIRPYEDRREARQLDRAPAELRKRGVLARLGARDLGDVRPPPYRDFARPPGGIRNEDEVARYSRSLGEAVGGALGDDTFLLVLGGDCSIVLGTLLGAGRRASRLGLAYIDAHADFGTPEESVTGSAASMCLALAVGRGESALARLAGAAPLVRPEDVALIGRRDQGQDNYGHAALATLGVLDLPDGAVIQRGPSGVAAAALERVARPDLDGFWIHLDADAIDPAEMPAVDSPEPGGLPARALAVLVRALADHPKAVGLQLTIYDPGLDPDGACAARLVDLLDGALGRRTEEASR